MFNIFRRRKSDRATSGGTTPLDAVRFDVMGYEPQGEPEPGRVRVWHTSEGDGLGLFFFPSPPDLPMTARSVEEIRAFYEAVADGSPARVVEVGLTLAGSVPAVRTILKMLQQPSGMTYVASLTLPFRDFSYVLKVQCAEQAPTGLREAVLLDGFLDAGGDPEALQSGKHVPGWDPDSAAHDEDFSDHPVARARQVLRHLETTLTVSDTVRAAPAFPLPEPRG